MIRLIIKRRAEPDNDEFYKRWKTFFEEFFNTPSCQFYYALYFARRLVVGCAILFVNHELVQLVISMAATLSVKNM